MSQPSDVCHHHKIIALKLPSKRNKRGMWYPHRHDAGFGIWLNDSTPIKCITCGKTGTRRALHGKAERSVPR